MTMIQQHTNIGYKLVVPLDFDPIVAEIILYHHENYDGSGYPSKLKANDIPLAARIVRVADVYDALTSNRPYRSAYSKKEAIRIIEKENSQFDPQVLSILYKIVLEKKSNTSKSKAG
jgi:HD-GYP domain-containing protein (c-di-GMP phosphodiesterase class II)